MLYSSGLLEYPNGDIGVLSAKVETNVNYADGVIVAVQNVTGPYISIKLYLCFDGDVNNSESEITVSEDAIAWDGGQGKYVVFRSYTHNTYRQYYAAKNITMYDISTSAYSMYTVGSVDTPLTNALLLTTGDYNDALQAARDYFDTPATPYMDIDVFTSGADGNKLITVDWDNIQNLPADMYPASYFVKIHADDDGQAGRNLALCPYNNKEYQVTYQSAISQMFESEQTAAYTNGYIYINVFLCHNEGSEVEIDQSAHFKVLRDGSITDETDPGEAGNRGTHPNTSPRHNGEYADGTGSLTGDDAGQALSVDNILTTSYAVSETDLGLFGDWLWANDLQQTLFGNQVSPMENILSCKRIPFDVDTGSATTIWLGNIDSHVAAHFAGTNTHKQPVGSGISIPMPCGGTFLDEQNNVSIYLPYCGIHSIPTSICYDKTLETITLPNGNTFDVPKLTPRTLTVEYVFDMIYGSCAALLYMGGSLFGVYNGSCGVDIPLTQSNRASNQLALNKDGGNMVTGIITSTVGGMISGAMAGGLIGAGIGGLIGAGESALGGALRTKNNAVNQETHFTTSGGFSSQIASFMPSSVMVFVEYTDEGAGEQAFTDFQKVYAHENGFPCNLNLNMGDIVGYTELAGSIEIDSIPCLEEERILLKQALQEGFYL